MAFTIFLWCLAVLWLTISVSTLFHLRWARRLPLLEAQAELPHPGGGKKVACSIVIAARDEEARISATVRHLLDQRGAAIEIIVVDDRSSDRTGEILRRLAMEDARVRTLRVETLPERWLGKCHACHLGAEAATGDWILFTDADCWMRADVIARAFQAARRTAADHVTLTPGVTPETLGGRAWHVMFLLSAISWISRVNRARPNAHLGIGAFNLMRTPAYRACGGYEALRLTVVDDVKLGLLLQRTGFRTQAFIGGDDVNCHWGTTVPGMIRIMEKNYFAILDYRLAPALVIGIAVPAIWAATLLAPFTTTTAGLAAGAALLSMIIPASVVVRRLGWPWTCAAAAPFMFPVLCYAVIRSAIMTLRQGGIRWRGTFYPLQMLREGTVK